MDRLGWTVGQTYSAYGKRFAIRSNSIDVFERMTRALPPGAAESKDKVVESRVSVLDGGEPRGPIRRFHAGYLNEQRLAKSFDLSAIIERMSDEMHFMIASLARTRVFLHSGVVALDGRAILIPGYTESGKSTLVKEFLAAGATLYSDEYAVLDRQGFVHPFPRPIQLRAADGTQSRHDPVEMDVPVGTRPIRVGLVLHAKFEPDAVWNPRRLSPGQAALKLMQYSVNVRREPKAVLQLLKQIGSTSAAFKSRRGQAREVVDWCQKNLSN